MSDQSQGHFPPRQPDPQQRPAYDYICPRCGSSYLTRARACPYCGNRHAVQKGGDEMTKKVVYDNDLIK